MGEVIAEYVGEDNMKDIKLSLAAFVAIVVMIFHYAYIMKQMITDVEMSSQTMYTHFALFGVTVVVSIAILVKYAYPRIYADNISEEKKKQ